MNCQDHIDDSLNVPRNISDTFFIKSLIQVQKQKPWGNVKCYTGLPNILLWEIVSYGCRDRWSKIVNFTMRLSGTLKWFHWNTLQKRQMSKLTSKSKRKDQMRQKRNPTNGNNTVKSADCCNENGRLTWSLISSLDTVTLLHFLWQTKFWFVDKVPVV